MERYTVRLIVSYGRDRNGRSVEFLVDVLAEDGDVAQDIATGLFAGNAHLLVHSVEKLEDL